MGHITNATAFRLGYVKKWVSSWTAEAKLYKIFLHQDFLIFRFMKAFFMQYSTPVFFYEKKIEEEKTEDKDKKEEKLEDKIKIKPKVKIKKKPKTEDELEEEKAKLIPITQRNKRTEAANKLSGNDTIIPSPFVDHSFTFSHLTITRSYTLGINCHFMDSLLENWRLTLMNKHTAVPSRVFRPFPIKSYLPRFLTQFKRRSHLYKFKRKNVKRRFWVLARKFKTYKFFVRKRKQQKNKQKRLKGNLKKYRLKKTLKFSKLLGTRENRVRPRVSTYRGNQQQFVYKYQQYNLNKQQPNFNYQPYRLNQQQINPKYQPYRLNQQQSQLKYQPYKSNQHQFKSRNPAYGLTQHQYNSISQPYKTNQHQFKSRNPAYGLTQHQYNSISQPYKTNPHQFNLRNQLYSTKQQQSYPKNIILGLNDKRITEPSKKSVLTTQAITPNIQQNPINKKNTILSRLKQELIKLTLNRRKNIEKLKNLRRHIQDQSKILIKLTLKNTIKKQELRQLRNLTLINKKKKQELKKITLNIKKNIEELKKKSLKEKNLINKKLIKSKIENLNLIVLKGENIEKLVIGEIKKIKLIKSEIENLKQLLKDEIKKIKYLIKSEIEKEFSIKTTLKKQKIIKLRELRKIRNQKLREKRIKLRIKLRDRRIKKGIRKLYISRRNKKTVKISLVSLFKKRLILAKNSKITVLADFKKKLANLARDIIKSKNLRKKITRRQKKKTRRNEKRISKHHRNLRKLARLRNKRRRRKYFRYKPRIDMHSKMAAYPISLYQLLLQTPKTLHLPPTTKAFKMLKILILMFPVILQTVMKKQFFYLTLFRQCLMFLLTLPFYVPKTMIFRILTMLFLKESSYKNLNIYYFKKLVSSRFLIFQGAHSAIISSLKAFDKNDKITVTFYGMHIRNLTASLVCNYIIYKLGQYFTIKEILRPLIRDFYHSKNLAGFRVIVAGRLTRKERAAYMVRRKGQITLSKKSLFIDYAADFKIMRFGVVGIKIWLNQRKFAPNFYAFKFTSYFNEGRLETSPLINKNDNIFLGIIFCIVFIFFLATNQTMSHNTVILVTRLNLLKTFKRELSIIPPEDSEIIIKLKNVVNEIMRDNKLIDFILDKNLLYFLLIQTIHGKNIKHLEIFLEIKDFSEIIEFYTNNEVYESINVDVVNVFRNDSEHDIDAVPKGIAGFGHTDIAGFGHKEPMSHKEIIKRLEHLSPVEPFDDPIIEKTIGVFEILREFDLFNLLNLDQKKLKVFLEAPFPIKNQLRPFMQKILDSPRNEQLQGKIFTDFSELVALQENLEEPKDKKYLLWFDDALNDPEYLERILACYKLRLQDIIILHLETELKKPQNMKFKKFIIEMLTHPFFLTFLNNAETKRLHFITEAISQEEDKEQEEKEKEREEEEKHASEEKAWQDYVDSQADVGRFSAFINKQLQRRNAFTDKPLQEFQLLLNEQLQEFQFLLDKQRNDFAYSQEQPIDPECQKRIEKKCEDLELLYKKFQDYSDKNPKDLVVLYKEFKDLMYPGIYGY